MGKEVKVADLTEAQIPAGGKKAVERALMAKLLDQEYDTLTDGRPRVIEMYASDPKKVGKDPDKWRFSVTMDYELARPDDAAVGERVHGLILKAVEKPGLQPDQPIQTDFARSGAIIFSRDGAHWLRTALDDIPENA
jgi:hypothetical protein